MPNAIEMLREDHRKVKGLFEEFANADESQKKSIVETALHELEIHTALEEQIFYPAAREHADEPEQLDEANEEHHVVELLANELKKMKPGAERYDAKFTVLSENVKHHIEEEESELFPSIENELDLEGLGEEMQTRKEELEKKLSRSSNRSGSKSRSSSRSTSRGQQRSKAKRTTGKKSRGKAAGGRR